VSYYSYSGEGPTGPPEELSPRPPGLEEFARTEGLVGEEDALLRVPPEQRDEKTERRLKEVSAELDRMWEHLRQRAERLGHHHRGSS
jgi:hypothetical protein